jgi:hypothetical protein
MATATTTQTKAVAGFVGKIERTNKATRYGVRPVTTLSVGVRDKKTKTTSWNYVNIWGAPNIKKGDSVRVEDVKSYGRSRYGKLVDHDARNKRDRKPQAKVETTPQQLPLF